MRLNVSFQGLQLYRPWAIDGPIRWLLTIDQLDSMVIDPCVREDMSAKLAYSAGMFVRASSATKPAIWDL